MFVQFIITIRVDSISITIQKKITKIPLEICEEIRIISRNNYFPWPFIPTRKLRRATMLRISITYNCVRILFFRLDVSHHFADPLRFV